MQLLGSCAPDLRQLAAGLLNNAATADPDGAVCAAAAAAGAIPPLVALLCETEGGGVSACQRRAAGALEGFVDNVASCREAARHAGAVAPLVQLLGSEDPGARWRAAGVLWTLARDPEGRQEFEGEIEKLLGSCDAGVAERAREVVGRVRFGDEGMSEVGVVVFDQNTIGLAHHVIFGKLHHIAVYLLYFGAADGPPSILTTVAERPQPAPSLTATPQPIFL